MSREEVDKWSKDWTGFSPDVVLGEYIEERLVFPLPPLVGRHWNENVVHEPDIPLMKEEVTLSDSEAAQERMYGRQPTPGRGGRGGPVPGQPRGFGRGEGPLEADPDNPFAPKGEAVAQVNVPEPERAATETKALKYKLFRYFDFDVQPGKQYVYRVRLALRNPNKGQKPGVLKSPDWATKLLLETPWSDPSPVIAVPRAWGIFASGVKFMPRVEPTGEILVTQWVPSKAVEVSKKFSVVRGQVVNFTESVTAPRIDLTAEVGGLRSAFAKRGGGGEDRRATGNAPIEVHFDTGATVLDLRGGERPSRGRGTTSLPAAGEILYLDATGTLVMRNELDNFPACERYANLNREVRPEPGPPKPTPGPPPKGALEQLTH